MTVAVRGAQKWSGYRGACTSLDEVVAYHYNVSGERIRASLSEVLQANAGKTVVVTYNVRDYTCEIVGLREPDAIGNPSGTIRKTLRGAVDLRSDDSETVKPGEAITTDNPMSRLTWEITLEAGKERTGTYRYTVWVRV